MNTVDGTIEHSTERAYQKEQNGSNFNVVGLTMPLRSYECMRKEIQSIYLTIDYSPGPYFSLNVFVSQISNHGLESMVLSSI